MPSPAKHINRRMRYILAQLRDGFRSKAIAHQLGLSDVTVAFNIREAQRLLGAKTVTHTVVLAVSRGVISGRYANGGLTHPELEVPFDLEELGKHEGYPRD